MFSKGSKQPAGPTAAQLSLIDLGEGQCNLLISIRSLAHCALHIWVPDFSGSCSQPASQGKNTLIRAFYGQIDEKQRDFSVMFRVLA
jgi:hypothetical protein